MMESPKIKIKITKIRINKSSKIVFIIWTTKFNRMELLDLYNWQIINKECKNRNKKRRKILINKIKNQAMCLKYEVYFFKNNLVVKVNLKLKCQWRKELILKED